MPGINFINTNPAIDQFNARVQQGDQARRLEEQDFRQRFQLEQAMGADKARRAGAEAYFATPQTATAPTVATPTAVPATAAPAIASYTAQPQPAQQPDAYSYSVGGNTIPNAMDFGNQPRLSDAEISARMGTSAPAPTQQPAASQPAIATVRARPTASAEQGDRFSRMASTMAKTPGTGTDLLRMVTADVGSRRGAAVEERKLHMEGIKLFTDASKNGDVATMRAVSQRYDLGIPPEALNRREIMANIASGINTAKSMGITDDARAIAFGMGYVQSIAANPDPRVALQAGFAEAQKAQATGAGFKPKHWFVGPDNTVQAAGEDMTVRSTGAKARPPQPPFNLTATATDIRDQGLRDKAMDNARTEAGRRWDRMAPDEKQSRIDYHYEFLKTGKPKTPPPGRQAAPAAAPAKRLKFDAQGNQVQ